MKMDEHVDCDRLLNEAEDEIKVLRAIKCPPISEGDTCICPIEQQAEQIIELEEKLEDWENSAKFVLGNDCPTDEVRCGCVVILKKRIIELEELLIEYGGHQPGCPNQYGKKYHCRCGWEKVEQDLKGKPHECTTCWYGCDVKNISECPLKSKAKDGDVKSGPK